MGKEIDSGVWVDLEVWGVTGSDGGGTGDSSVRL